VDRRGPCIVGPARRTGEKAMVRSALAALAAVVLVGASLMPDDAFARGAAAVTAEVEAFTEAP